MPTGYFCLFLHTHLPFVRHPEEEYFLEENWLYEAITESYLPLLGVFDRLAGEGVKFRAAMSLTPPLVSMLQDELLQERYLGHLRRLLDFAEKEVERTAYDHQYHGLALLYQRRLQEAEEAYLIRHNRDLISAFRRLQDGGFLEITASAATHGFLPTIGINRTAAQAQIRLGIDHYQKTFGRRPLGFWLPECGYYPGLDELLKAEGIRYFLVDSHSILHADPAPRYSVYAPLYCPSGVAAFGRDWESSKQVWSAREGYPGDPDYREYHRDAGHELEYEYVRPYIHPMGIRINTGFKYWRVTGNTEYKAVYNADAGREKAALHAADFLQNRQKQAEYLAGRMDRAPVVVAPYDAELFGHWWYEGPQWIDYLIRKTVYDQQTIQLATPLDYLAACPVNQLSQPAAASWGWKGYNEVWLAGSNDWTYRHLHLAGQRMAELAGRFRHVLEGSQPPSLIKRALHQAARELLLAESSDWPFIMKMGTMVPYAEKRFRTHLSRFNRIYGDLQDASLDERWLREVESRDNIFRDMDCANYYLEKEEIKIDGGTAWPEKKAEVKRQTSEGEITEKRETPKPKQKPKGKK